MKAIVCLVALFLIGVVQAGQKCTGTPRKYNGKLCASTTRYADYHKGACGCGPDNGDSQFGWNHNGYVVAANEFLFDNGGSRGWCGSNCGRCIKLTTTGGYVDGQGGPGPAGVSKVFMITNLCPNVFPNLSWCSQGRNRQNQYGYDNHFDLENGANQIYGASHSLNWNNAEVTWEFVDCSNGHDSHTPSSNMFRSQCFCGKHPGGGKK